MFEKIHQETFGKVGVIRGLPGQYLAVDPSGRAFMISNIGFFLLTRRCCGKAEFGVRAQPRFPKQRYNLLPSRGP